MAREILERAGTRTTSMSQEQLIERGLHSTGDFPALLQGAGNRVLRAGYEAYEGGIRRIARQASVRDFRARQAVNLGEWPKLLPVAEGGEFKHGTMAEATEAYTLTTWGRIFGITRQALLNDDLDAFGTMAARVGRAAAETESTVLAALLTSNPVMSDGKALFHADHGNIATGGGSALDVAALSAARKAMRLQKGLDGQTIVDVTPVYLVVPAALETVAEQLVATLQPGAITSVNPFAGKLQVVVDPRLDASSVTAWYLAASQAQIDTIEYSYLEGSSGPQLITREGFEVDGLELKARLDFGAGVLDWRGLYKAAGA
ncbi:MAG: Mu-like prophage major head subunit gpT family protein [Rubrivivax sp.]|nr:Mu-like prophage major head subunit gpT family protein [Rubrivivax sp.]